MKRNLQSSSPKRKVRVVPSSPVPYDPSLSPTRGSSASTSEAEPVHPSEPQIEGVLVKPLINWVLIEEFPIKTNNKYKRTEKKVVFNLEHNFGGLPELMEFQSAIDNAFETAVRPMLSNAQPSDKFTLLIESEGLDKDIYLRPQNVSDFDKTRFLNQIYKTCQSKREFLNSGLMNVKASIYSSLSGSGRGSKAPTTIGEDIDRKRSVVKIRNDDNSCGYRAIAIGKIYYEMNIQQNSNQCVWNNLRKRDIPQRKAAQRLCEELGLDIQTPLNIDILMEIDSELTDYQIIVIDAKNNSQIFTGTDRPKTIYLLYDGEHYDFIKRMESYLVRNHYCKYCNRGFNETHKHQCDQTCKKCRTNFGCSPDGSHQKCSECRVVFTSNDCFTRHKNNKMCDSIKFCPRCEIRYTFDRRNPHKCGTFFCRECHLQYEQQPHYCFMQPLDANKLAEEDQKPKILIAFDIECMIEKTDNISSHTPILLISRSERGDEQIFYGTECVQSFVDWLIVMAKQAEKDKIPITVFAHNNSRYDGHFVLRELLRRELKSIEPIMGGTKIFKIDVGNIRFIDSLLFFQRALADLPKMFGIVGEEKGFFPHYLNTPSNQSLVCTIGEISKDLFGYKNMSAKRASDFDKWFDSNADKTFNLKSDMIRYCQSDVRILMESILRFRRLFIETTGIDPLSRTITLASIGSEFFRAKILPANTIGITPIGGYNNYGEQSHMANAWLDWIEQKTERKLIREFKVGKYKIDGVMDCEFIENGSVFTKIAFEFLGCYHHGHDCAIGRDIHDLRERDEYRFEYLQRQGFKPVFQRECEWNEKVRRKGTEYDKSIADYFHQRYRYYQKVNTKNPEKEKLFAHPRKALFGGRTNNLKFYAEGNIKYYDFTSLYPWVLARCEFPGGHPTVYRENFPDLRSVFGFISCKVLPPNQLYLPVLPLSVNGKLVFPLCKSCAKNQMNNSCFCPDDDRAFTGTFVSVELQKALDLGYKVIKIYEVLHYPTRITDLFKEYVNRWYKIKAEASGWPSNCLSEDQKQKYLQEFERKEGFNLENVESNPGLRSIAKLMLNSFWGKLAQRPNLPQTKVIKDYVELWDLFNDENIEILGEEMIEEMLLFNYKYIDDANASPGQTSVAIASFVTSYARLKLYSEMEKIENSNPRAVLYFDTDSIVFVHSPGYYAPTVGNFLGEMTDEIIEEYGVGSHISEFYTTGPKTYAYKVSTPSGDKFKFKAKGITQNIESLDYCNFHTIKEKAVNKANETQNTTTLIPQMQFRCNSKHIVSTQHLKKRFNVTSDKRRVLGNETLPYGYVDEDINDFANLMYSYI